MDVPGSHVLQDPGALVLMFDTLRLVRSDQQAGVASTTHLDAGLFIDRDRERDRIEVFPDRVRVFVNAETSWRRLFPTVSYG